LSEDLFIALKLLEAYYYVSLDSAACKYSDKLNTGLEAISGCVDGDEQSFKLLQMTDSL
jgi:hypothetical protein